MVLGLFIGFILGFIGNVHDLGNLASWGEIATSAISTAAVMAIFPKIASLICRGIYLLTESTKGAAKKHGKGRKWYLAVNDATGYGEPATIMVGTLMIPIMLALAFALPGNRALIMVDLIAMPYCMIPMISISKGNMLKTLIGTMLYFSLALYVWGWMADFIYNSGSGRRFYSYKFHNADNQYLLYAVFGSFVCSVFIPESTVDRSYSRCIFCSFYFLQKNKEAITNYMLTCNDVKTANEVSA